tara:strand:+ start:965 stop:1186 length:222 start_codon:yes stop_codon:yes gene_type:complete
MLHTIDDLLKRVTAMRDLAMQAHREKYTKSNYNEQYVTSLVEQIQSLAASIAGDKTLHPKLKQKKDITESNDS